MKETPLLFKPEMVRATLREIDPKDQTRRLVNRLLRFGKVTEFGKSDTPGYDWHFRDKEMRWHDISDEMLMDRCPYGKPGDRLWVKETYAHHVQAIGAQRDEEGPFVYAADGELATQYRLGDKWKPSIFMFRYASRILLEITDIRVERLREISEEDAKAEGITGPHHIGYPAYSVPGDSKPRYSRAEAAYEALWESINGAGSWDANPWVWVISFKRIQS